MTSFYSNSELQTMGFKAMGRNVLISKFARFYSIDTISVGDNSRIDDFCIISGLVSIGRNVHIAAGCYLYAGNAGITFQDYSGLSSKGTVYAVTDDYSGKMLTNPTVPMELRGVIENPVIIGRHVVIGASSVILPGVTIAEGCSFGAMSLINKSTEPWGVYYGVPCKRMKERYQDLLELQRVYEKDMI